MIKIFKNRNNIFNIGKRTRKYTAKINSGNAIGTFINNSIVETKKRGAQRRGEEAREQRENERKKKREASQRKAKESASRVRANKREREREKEKRLEQARIKKIYNNQRKEYNLLIKKIFSKDQNKIKKNIDLTIHLYEKKIINSLRTFGPLDEDQTLKKLLEISTNPKAQEILTIENDRVKRLKTKERGAQRRREEAREQREKERIKLELIKKEKLELDKKKYFDEKLKKELLNEKKKKELEKKISNFVQKKIKFLMSKNKVKNLIKKFIHKDEVIKFIDYGTLNVSSLSPPGYLILTDKRFLFHSKFLFLKESLTEIPLSNVLGVIFDKSLLKTNIVKFKIKDQKDLVYKDLADSLSDAWNDARNVEENSDFSIQYLKLIFNQN